MLMAPLNAFERLFGYVSADCLGGLAVGLAVAVACFVFADLGAAHPWAIVVFGLLGMTLYALIGVLVGIWAEKWEPFLRRAHLPPGTALLPFGCVLPDHGPAAAAPDADALQPALPCDRRLRYGVSGAASGEPVTHVLVLLGGNLALGWWAFRWFRLGLQAKALMVRYNPTLYIRRPRPDIPCSAAFGSSRRTPS